MAVATVKNTHRVPKAQWRKWPARARETFNYVYSLMYDNPRLFTHPKAVKEKAHIWKTTAWNTAWIAADCVRDVLRAERSKAGTTKT